ncbi:MAG: NADH-ubiquinone oxidoreductase-F iron-sulfur binding region domain-containing protein, partial [Gammaproteobacteria bacterium]|nr:NADH-ubiquinone oxidoreductase-F iron-sulfur binding region domain-containing protein [Gammaproteobacteria bacterium]
VESCGKCTPCRIGSVRGVELLDQIIVDRNAQAERNEQSFELLADLCATMTNTSLCGMGRMTPSPVRSALKYFSEDFYQAAP